MGEYDNFARALVAFGDGLNNKKQATTTPSNILEWQSFQSMTPEQQQQYLLMKRAQPVLNQGNQFGAYNPVTQQTTPVAPINPPPEAMPTFRGEQARQTAIGTGVGESEATAAKKEVQAPNIATLIKEAETILPDSTSGLGEKVITGGMKMAGKSTDASKADAKLKVLSAALTSTVPRFEGPQGVLDVELYKQAAADVANTSLPYQDREAALSTMKKLNAQYLPEGGMNSPQGGAVPLSSDAPPGTLIGTSDGKKVYQLPDGSYVMEQ
jgi:hypothetical protein